MFCLVYFILNRSLFTLIRKKRKSPEIEPPDKKKTKMSTEELTALTVLQIVSSFLFKPLMEIIIQSFLAKIIIAKIKIALHIQMTPDNKFNRDLGLELPGCWLSMPCM